MKTSFFGLRTTVYKVGNIAEAKIWYSKIFQTAPSFDEPYYVGFTVAGYELGLQPEDVPSIEKAESVIAYWGVSDIESEFERMLGLGAIMHEKPTNVGGEIIIASVKDLWGNVIGIIYNPEFKL